MALYKVSCIHHSVATSLTPDEGSKMSGWLLSGHVSCVPRITIRMYYKHNDDSDQSKGEGGRGKRGDYPFISLHPYNAKHQHEHCLGFAYMQCYR